MTAIQDITPEERAELERLGERAADCFESGDWSAKAWYHRGDEPPGLALELAALQRALALQAADKRLSEAVAKARKAGWSWHKIGLPLHMTAEGTRKRFAHG